jgi:hypothetical protein
MSGAGPKSGKKPIKRSCSQPRANQPVTIARYPGVLSLPPRPAVEPPGYPYKALRAGNPATHADTLKTGQHLPPRDASYVNNFLTKTISLRETLTKLGV